MTPAARLARDYARSLEDRLYSETGIDRAGTLRQLALDAEGWVLEYHGRAVLSVLLVGEEHRVTYRQKIRLTPREQTLADMASWGWFDADAST